MKRIILLITLICLLAACGGETDAPAETAPVENAEQADASQEVGETDSGSSDPTAPPPPPPTDIAATATPVQAVTATPETETAGDPTEEPIVEAESEPTSPTSEPTTPSPDSGQAVPTEPPAQPEAPVTSIRLAQVAAGLPFPLGLTHADDNRLFIVGKRGVIQIMRNGQMFTAPFLDISGRVGLESEQGLLGMAFDPNFVENGRFYIHYSDLSGNTVISRYVVSANDPDAADPNSEQIIMTIPQPYRNHNGGQIKFGPDGYLYIGMGDGGSQNDPENLAQNGSSLLGKMLRIDVSGDGGYGVPSNNPFVGNADFADEIWSYGFRNPWRFSFDRTTGDLFIADVGQNRTEEVSFQPGGSGGGENYGWRPYEGNSCIRGQECLFQPVLAVAELSHDNGNCSITGGYVYRGQQFPALRGNYFFTDFCSGVIYSLFQNEDGGWVQTAVFQGPTNISSFGEDANGELYVMTLSRNGELFQIQAP